MSLAKDLTYLEKSAIIDCIARETKLLDGGLCSPDLKSMERSTLRSFHFQRASKQYG
jgi:hypothetical protein